MANDAAFKLPIVVDAETQNAAHTATPKSTLDCFVKIITILGINYHVHDGIYAEYGLIPEFACTLMNCSKSSNYQYEGSR